MCETIRYVSLQPVRETAFRAKVHAVLPYFFHRRQVLGVFRSRRRLFFRRPCRVPVPSPPFYVRLRAAGSFPAGRGRIFFCKKCAAGRSAPAACVLPFSAAAKAAFGRRCRSPKFRTDQDRRGLASFPPSLRIPGLTVSFAFLPRSPLRFACIQAAYRKRSFIQRKYISLPLLH